MSNISRYIRIAILIMGVSLLDQSAIAGTVVIQNQYSKDGKIYVKETVQSDTGNDNSVIHTHPSSSQTVQRVDITSSTQGIISVQNTSNNNAETMTLFQDTQKKMLSSLSNCTNFQASVTDPMNRKESIFMQVEGSFDGKCKYTQTTQSGSSLTCFFSDQQRSEIRNSGYTTFQYFLQNPSICKSTGK
jgi:hypothetical protein